MTARDAITVRPGGPNDAADLAGLRWRWRVDERGEVAPSTADFTAAFAGWAADHRDTHLPFVAHCGEEAIGMTWLAIITRVPGPGIWRRVSGLLQSVYVVPEHRNAGVGARLVTATLDAARDRGLDYVIVHPSERSFPLYRRLGFAESGGVLERRF